MKLIFGFRNSKINIYRIINFSILILCVFFSQGVYSNEVKRNIYCPFCGQLNNDTANFCINCGKKLRNICLNCKTINDYEASFCRKCGSPLTTNRIPKTSTRIQKKIKFKQNIRSNSKPKKDHSALSLKTLNSQKENKRYSTKKSNMETMDIRDSLLEYKYYYISLDNDVGGLSGQTMFMLSGKLGFSNRFGLHIKNTYQSIDLVSDYNNYEFWLTTNLIQAGFYIDLFDGLRKDNNSGRIERHFNLSLSVYFNRGDRSVNYSYGYHNAYYGGGTDLEMDIPLSDWLIIKGLGDFYFLDDIDNGIFSFSGELIIVPLQDFQELQFRIGVLKQFDEDLNDSNVTYYTFGLNYGL